MPGRKKLNTDPQLSVLYPTAVHHDNVQRIAITLDAQKNNLSEYFMKRSFLKVVRPA
jgi:hypothetical protein